MKYTLDDTFKKQLALATKKLDNSLILKKSEVVSQSAESPSLAISSQELFKIRQNNIKE